MNKNLTLFWRVGALFFITFLISCGAVQTVALKTTAGVIYDASYGAEEENSLHIFETSVPGNLKLAESLWSSDRDNENLLVSLIKGYSGYAFTIYETNYLNDFLAENDKEENKTKALQYYSRAMSYGLIFLGDHGITYDAMVKAAKSEEGLVGYLDDKLSSDLRTLEGVMFTAQALASMVNMQRTNMTMVGQLPIAKGMFDWVCEQDPKLYYGTCDIFLGAYEAGRPKMLGGNPEKGREIFEKAIKKYPHNWLIRVAFIQYYIIPMSEEDLYAEQKAFLEKAQLMHDKELIWKPFEKRPEAFSNPRMRIYQTIAMDRFKIIKKYEEDIF